MKAQTLAPVPRVALTREEAAASLGLSLRHFERHVQPHLRIVRSGSVRLVPVAELERWAEHRQRWPGAPMTPRLDVQIRSAPAPRNGRGHDPGGMTSMSARKRTPMRVGVESRKTRRDASATALRSASTASLSADAPGARASPRPRAEYVDMLAGLQAGTLSGERGPHVRVAVEQFVAGIKDGSIRDRSGTTTSPHDRGYERDLRQRVEPAFGAARLCELRLPDVQRWADELASQGSRLDRRNSSTRCGRSTAGRCRAASRSSTRPRGLRLPTGGEARPDRHAGRGRGSVAALLPRDQAALGLAGYGGLRLGELLALDWSASTWRRARCASSAPGTTARSPSPARSRRPGSARSRSTSGSRPLLADHRVLTDHRDGLLFPAAGDPSRPFANALRDRMRAAWKDAGLEALGFHEARHTFASLMIAAGVNAKALSTYLGHANIAITFDRYGHLMPGADHEARGLLDAYLERMGAEVYPCAYPRPAEVPRLQGFHAGRHSLENRCGPYGPPRVRILPLRFCGLGWQVASARKVRDVAPLPRGTDKVDARVLAELCRRDLVPSLWVPSLDERALRERLRRRMHLVRLRAAMNRGGERACRRDRLPAGGRDRDALRGAR